VSLARVSDDRANLYLVNGHRQPVAQQVDTLARSTAAAAAATAATGRSVTAPRQLARQQLGTSPNTVTTFITRATTACRTLLFSHSFVCYRTQ